MAFLAPHFDPDVFVSYSHGDPRGRGASPLKDWTQEFVKRLEAQIDSLEDEFDGLRFWCDRDLDPTAHLTHALKAQAAGSGVLVIVMSKRYLGSSWCRDELEWFRMQVQARNSDIGRVFIVKAQQTDSAVWPDFLRDERGHAMPGFVFYDPATGFPLGWPDLKEPTREFFIQLGHLQTTLLKRLKALREREGRRNQAEASPLPLAPGAPRRVYLHAPPESELLRVDIGRALSGEGIVPLTANVTVTGSLGDWQRDAGAMRETAKRCEALALLRADANERFIGDLLEIGVDERERIASARGAPLPCAVFDASGEDLPFDVSPWGIARFDVRTAAWKSDFRTWLDGARNAG